MHPLVQNAPLAVKAALPVAIVLFAVAVGLPSGGGRVAFLIFRSIAGLLAFVGLFLAGFAGLTVARVRFEKILEASKRWEALKAYSGPAKTTAGPPGIPGALQTAPAPMPGFSGVLPNLKQAPVDILFTNWGMPYELSREFGTCVCWRLACVVCHPRALFTSIYVCLRL